MFALRLMHAFGLHFQFPEIVFEIKVGKIILNGRVSYHKVALYQFHSVSFVNPILGFILECPSTFA